MLFRSVFAPGKYEKREVGGRDQPEDPDWSTGPRSTRSVERRAGRREDGEAWTGASSVIALFVQVDASNKQRRVRFVDVHALFGYA